MTKNCIFHVPNYIDENIASGSQIRPIKMINAFKSIGYDVDIIMGYGENRKRQISNIKKNMMDGKKYDFLYSESSTMPTLLTEKHHLPSYPFLDFDFFNFCKNKNIKIGLFYRDIHWAFPHYKDNVNLFKRTFATMFYKYDLRKYNQLVDILYLVSKGVVEYMPVKFNGRVEVLPPGVDSKQVALDKRTTYKKELEIFYVGGIGDLYDLKMLFQAVKILPFLKLTVCCRENEWISQKQNYEEFLNSRITIIHKSGDELKNYFNRADLFTLFVKPLEYWNLALPVKLFEDIGQLVPLISVRGTASGIFIKEHDIGWDIDYNFEKLTNKLQYLYKNQDELSQKINNIKKISKYNTWEARAMKVANQLSE